MQKAVELEVNNYTLRGMIHQPKGEGPFPTVILYHGFTGTKLEPHNIFRKMSQALVSEGIASVRFDFGGHGESDGDFETMTLTREVAEAHAIREFTLKMPFVDRQRLGLLGLSLGGAVASIVAGDVPETIRALSLWAPAGMLPHVLNQLLEQSGRPNGHGQIDIWGNLLGPQAGEDAAKWDVYQRAKPYSGPVMLIHGEADPTVPLEASLRYQTIYGKQAELVIVPEGDHTFNRVEWEQQVIGKTLAFFRDRL